MGSPGYPHFCLANYKLRVPMAPRSRFGNLLDWLTELRKTLYLCLLVYCKGCKWTARWRGTKSRRVQVQDVWSWSVLPSWHVDAIWKFSRSCGSRVFILLFSFILFYFGRAARHVGSLVPQLKIEPMPPAVEAQRLNHWTAREVPQEFLTELFSPWRMGG